MYQKLILIGRVGQKKLSFTHSQQPVVQYSVATSKSFRDRESGNWTEKTEWHRLVSFEKCADHVHSKLATGDLIQVEGELRTRQWQDKNGTDHYTTEVVVNDFPKKLPRFYQRNGQASSGESFAGSQPVAQAAGQDFYSQGPSFDEVDEKIPF